MFITLFPLSSSFFTLLCRFGGTDGLYHYNDTWLFELSTQKWTELQCTGYILYPHEGHAIALVNDVMYVFGGHGIDGYDLSDLIAFELSSKQIGMLKMHALFVHMRHLAQQWYMFQNMGPSPSRRLGHAMASHGTWIFVVGGESSGSLEKDPCTRSVE